MMQCVVIIVVVVLLVASVLASMRWLLCGENEGSKINDICNLAQITRRGFISITDFIYSKKKQYIRKKKKMLLRV